MKTVTLALTLLLATTALAGCTLFGNNPTPTPSTSTPVPTTSTPPATSTPPPTTSTPPPTPGPFTNSSFTIQTPGVPGFAKPGARFNFTMFVNGTPTAETDHIGAHFGATSTATPSTVVYDKTCDHQTGTLPGTFLVNCTAPATDGTYYLRGHARVTSADGTFNYWGPEMTIRVVNYTLVAASVPSTAISNQPFTFTLNITGNVSLESSHIGAHFGNVSLVKPNTKDYAGACTHVSGTIPGVFAIACQITNPGLTPQKYFLRGHMRLTDAAGNQVDYWTDQEFEITVTPGV